MAKTQIFSLPDQPQLGLLAPAHADGSLTTGTLRPNGKLEIGACWRLLAVPGYDIFFDQRRGKVLCFTPDRRVTYESVLNEDVLSRARVSIGWDRETGDLAYVVPALHPTLALKHNGAGQGLGLEERSKKSAACRWKIDFAPAAPAEPLPSLASRALDDTYYNLRAAYADDCFLTIEDEQAAGARLLFGSDPRSGRAQFRVMPLPGGARIAPKQTLGTQGDDANARLAIVDQSATSFYPPMPMINLNGSRYFRTGDRVALRSQHQRYLGLGKSGDDIVAQGWSARPEDVFILRRVSGAGEIGPDDRFVLQASNGRYLHADADKKVRANAATAAAATGFTLDPPSGNSFVLVGRNSGHPLHLEAPDRGVRRLSQRFASGDRAPYSFQFERADDNHPDNFMLRCEAAGRGPIAATSPEGVAVVDPARLERNPGVGLIEFGLGMTGVTFVLQKAPTQAWPDTPDLTMEAYRDPAENYTRMIAGGIAQGAGALASTLLEVPGGASVFSFAFNLIWPQKETSTYDLFSRFRADLQRDMRRLIATNAVFQAEGALRNVHKLYLVNYLNSRRAHINTDVALPRAYITTLAAQFQLALAFLSLERGENNAIKDTPQNAEMVAAGLPVYVLIAMEYVNALQEAALMHAYDPAKALPDVYLKLRNGQYVLQDAQKGLISGPTQTPLTQAVRVLNRSGSATLHHGDTVLLRTPSGHNVGALEGGGGDLVATAPPQHVGGWEIFTVVKIGATVAGTPIADGDRIALQPEKKIFYLQAEGGDGKPVTARGPHPEIWETFTVETQRDKYVTEGMQLEAGALPPYEEHIDNLRQLARDAFKEIQRMFAYLVADRQSAAKYIYVDQHHESSWDPLPNVLLPGKNDKYTLSFRDKMYNWNIDRDHREWGDKPPGWDNYASYGPLNQAMDQYRQNLAHVYYNFKYRYFDAAQRLETIADETLELCRQMASDPLRATAFSYAARTTPRYQL